MMNNLNWTNRFVGTYQATSDDHTYSIILKPRPIDRYAVLVDGKEQCATNGDQAGQCLLLYYLKEAQEHCVEIANGRMGFRESTTQRNRAAVQKIIPANSSCTSLPFPTADQVSAAVQVVTAIDDRVWPVVDATWEVLVSQDERPSEQMTKVLETYVVEIAKWGSLRQWLTDKDLTSAAQALWDIRDFVALLRGRDCSEAGIAEAVVSLLRNLVSRMQLRGVAKSHYSWASKILHWLLPTCVPIYDSLVRQELRLKRSGLNAYRQIVAWEYACAAYLQPAANEVLCGRRKMTILAAIDNCLWWTGKQQVSKPCG